MFRDLLTRIDWRRDAVLWGRLLAVAVVVLGIAGVALDPWDLGEVDNSFRVRFSIMWSLGIVWAGCLILIVTELVARLQGPEARPIPRLPAFIQGLGVVIVIVGCAVSTWNAMKLSGDEERLLGNSVRYAITSTIHPYLWQGGLLFLLAAIADYVGWPNDELPDEEEASIVVTEP